MASTESKLKPSHNDFSSILTRVRAMSTEADGHLIEANRALSHAIVHGVDLTNLEQPAVQNVLKRLGVAPKPKQWVLDSGLKKETRNQLIAGAILAEGRYNFFLELTGLMWRMLQSLTDSSVARARNFQSRAFYAVLHQNAQIEEILRNQQEKDLKAWREMMEALDASIQKEQARYVRLRQMEDALLDEAVDEFIDLLTSAHPDYDEIRHALQHEEEAKVRQFYKVLLAERVKHEVKVHRIHVELDEAKADPEQAHKIAHLNERMLLARRKIDGVHLRAAKQVGFGEHACENLAEGSKCVRQLDAHMHLSPFLKKLQPLHEEAERAQDRIRHMKAKLQQLNPPTPLKKPRLEPTQRKSIECEEVDYPKLKILS